MLGWWTWLIAATQTPVLSCGQTLTADLEQPFTVVNTQSAGVLSIAAVGADIEYWNVSEWSRMVLPASRIAIQHFAVLPGNSVRIRAAQPTALPARVRVQLELKCTASALADGSWFDRAQRIAASLATRMVDAKDVADVHALKLIAASPHTHAYGLHLNAVTLYRANQLLEAESEFVATADVWQTLNEDVLQASALLSAAHLADRRSDFAAAKARSEKAVLLFKRQSQPYFVLRADEIACRRLLREANLLEHTVCLERLIAGYQSLGEVSDAVSLAIDYASAQRSLGLTPKITELDQLVAQLPKDRELGVLVGRHHLLSAQLNLDNGLIDRALVDFQRATTIFSDVPFDGERWRINAMVQTANLLSSLGLHEQALGVLVQALHIVDAKAAPSRVASILVALGGTLDQAGKFQEARENYARAATIQSALKLAQDYSVSVLLQSEADFHLPNSNAVERSSYVKQFEQLEAIPAQYRARNEFLICRQLLRAGRRSESEKRLGILQDEQLREPDRNFYALLKSELALANAESALAQGLLATRLSEIAQAADKAPTAALAYLRVRSGERVRRAWVDMQTEASDPDLLFTTALLANPARFLTSVQSPVKNLALASKQAAGDVGFLTQLSGSDAQAAMRFSALKVPKLADLQARLPNAGRMLILLPGEKQSVALWVSREQAVVRILAGIVELQSALLEVSDALSKPTSSAFAADSALAHLSEIIFQGLSGDAAAAPEVLWVVADEVTAAIPFSALRWPGAPEPLLSSTALSYVTGIRLQTADELAPVEPAIAAKRVFFAPTYQAEVSSAAAQLTNLDFATTERASMEAALHQTVLNISGLAANRATLQNLLQTPGAWLHVAAHGRADPGVLGNAGVWLADPTSKENASDFLSWLELGNLRTQAELLILNACQSGTGAVPSRQANISFALALSVGGAKHVVAALWPVSDVASKTWIPEFYQGLGLQASAQNSAAGLRQAQLVMYRSPHYRHPFYWASLVHFQQVLF